MKLDPHRAWSQLLAEYEKRWLSSPGNIDLTIPGYVRVDISRCVEVLNCFRSPTVTGPGKARQWGFPDTFNGHMKEMSK
eukprot:2104529-Pyramimonas_sp.AAC.1